MHTLTSWSLIQRGARRPSSSVWKTPELQFTQTSAHLIQKISFWNTGSSVFTSLEASLKVSFFSWNASIASWISCRWKENTRIKLLPTSNTNVQHIKKLLYLNPLISVLLRAGWKEEQLYEAFFLCWQSHTGKNLVHTHLACSSRVLSFPETWKLYGWSSLVVCCTCIPSTPILQRTVKRWPTRLNLGVQHSRKLLNWTETAWLLDIIHTCPGSWWGGIFR